MDKVAAAQEEYDRLLEKQEQNLCRKAELGAKKTRLEKELAEVNKARKADPEGQTEDRKRLEKLRFFLNIAESI